MTISVQSGGDFGGMLTLAGEKSVAVAKADVFTLWQRFQFASYGFVQYIVKFFIHWRFVPFILILMTINSQEQEAYYILWLLFR